MENLKSHGLLGRKNLKNARNSWKKLQTFESQIATSKKYFQIFFFFAFEFFD